MKTADLTYLLTMADGENAIILEMIDIFVEQIEEFSSEMRASYESKDYNSLGMIAHKAKSSVAIMGMDFLAQKLKELELSCNEDKFSEKYQEIINIFESESKLAVAELLEYKKLHQMQ